MVFAAPTLASFRSQIDALPGCVAPGDIQNDGFLLGKEGKLAVYYAPLDWINAEARLVLVGLTPGWSQTKIAYEECCRALRQGISEDGASKAAKAGASFAGMRKRLCGWLDDLGVDDWLGIDTTNELFGERRDLVHTTSLIRYPVFVGSGASNYSGYNPTPINSSVLRSIIDTVLLPELAQLSDSLIVPMGRSVATALAAAGLDAGRCLFGFPHPSGANGHGPRQFATERDAMQRVVKRMPGRAR
jgi:hypothetical protein